MEEVDFLTAVLPPSLSSTVNDAADNGFVFLFYGPSSH